MHTGHRKRLKQRFLREGLSAFAPHEALELLLTYAIPQRDVNPLAHALIAHFGSFSAVLEADYEELQRFPGIGENAASLLSLMPACCGFYLRDRHGERPLLKNAAQAGEYCQSLFLGLDYEAIYMLCLDTQGRLIRPALLQRGTIDEAHIYSRTVVETALRHGAHAVVLTHNHPGGNALPSSADYEVTLMVETALHAVEIRLIDHIIVAEGTFLSLAQQHILQRGKLVAAQEFEFRVKNIGQSLTAPALAQEARLEGYDGFEPEDPGEKA